MSVRRATIADVAREAGVSPSTASVVFSGKTPVSDATRERVLAAAAELGYAGPDPRAASLRRGRSGIVGVVFTDRLGTAFLDPVTTVMMDGLSDGLADLGASLLLLRDDPDGGGAALSSAPVDAVVLVGCSARMREALDTVRSRGLPVVVIEGDAGDGVPQVRLDNREGIAFIARHLFELGHRDVVTVTLGLDVRREAGWVPDPDAVAITIDVTRDRLAGVRDVFPDARVYSTRSSLIDEGYAAGRAILAREPHPTAVIAQSDLLAAGVVRAATDAGLRVPEDLSVTGFDGVAVDGIAPLTLTTMVQPAAEKGRAAGAAITAMLADAPPASIHLTSVFRRGDTSAVPRAAPPAAP
ncbi:substrate-binding domain-containing protein [Microbacterium sp. SORGH_AS_0888]|uniref:substrate-binding domain-containing protein n=1 Tax=Microbacterium sp. SORGH_AS_0888 TaxID=3041791 RepID=UPI00278305FD|nr:substrate-binding domain-containing protein [Microbacterium sp. SORGH_AS_0888]MDQ1129976.1 DNA-binding LacI/PurR family transcriptional regulator [Microbacterium sp. SORGH_AS_0888]